MIEFSTFEAALEYLFGVCGGSGLIYFVAKVGKWYMHRRDENSKEE